MNVRTEQKISTNPNKRENRLTKKNKALETCGTITKDPTFISSEFWKERRKTMGLKDYSKKYVHLGEKANIKSQKSRQCDLGRV